MALQSPFFNKRENEGFPQRAATNTTPTTTTPPAGIVAASAPTAAVANGPKEGESKLIVGPNIKLKGVEITDCHTLVVEGSVEATMDSRVIQISETGVFRGTAEIDVAEIHGEFEGNLVARQKLVIYSTGRVTGKVRYGKIVIEEGGQLSGEVESSAAAARTATVKDLRVANK